jgi:hypothetical protein
MRQELTAERKRYRLAGTLELCAADNGMCAPCHAGSHSCLEASLYARALQGEPLRRFAHFARRQIVASQLPLESHFRVRLLE